MMMGHFIFQLFEGTLHVDKIHVRFKIAHITHVLPVPVYRQTDFTLKPVVILRLQDTIAKFCIGAKFCSGTTTGVNCAATKVAPGSCKHPLKVSNTSI